MSSCDRLSQASCTCCHNSTTVVAGSGEKVPSLSCLILVQLVRDLGILLVRVVVHQEEHVASQQSYVDMRCPAEKAHHLPVEEMIVARH